MRRSFVKFKSHDKLKNDFHVTFSSKHLYISTLVSLLFCIDIYIYRNMCQSFMKLYDGEYIQGSKTLTPIKQRHNALTNTNLNIRYKFQTQNFQGKMTSMGTQETKRNRLQTVPTTMYKRVTSTVKPHRYREA